MTRFGEILPLWQKSEKLNGFFVRGYFWYFAIYFCAIYFTTFWANFRRCKRLIYLTKIQTSGHTGNGDPFLNKDRLNSNLDLGSRPSFGRAMGPSWQTFYACKSTLCTLVKGATVRFLATCKKESGCGSVGRVVTSDT